MQSFEATPAVEVTVRPLNALVFDTILTQEKVSLWKSLRWKWVRVGETSSEFFLEELPARLHFHRRQSRWGDTCTSSPLSNIPERDFSKNLLFLVTKTIVLFHKQVHLHRICSCYQYLEYLAGPVGGEKVNIANTSNIRGAQYQYTQWTFPHWQERRFYYLITFYLTPFWCQDLPCKWHKWSFSWSIHHIGPIRNISTYDISFCTVNHGPQRKNLLLAPPNVLHLWLWVIYLDSFLEGLPGYLLQRFDHQPQPV